VVKVIKSLEELPPNAKPSALPNSVEVAMDEINIDEVVKSHISKTTEYVLIGKPTAKKGDPSRVIHAYQIYTTK